MVNVVELWVATGVLAKAVTLGLAAMLVAVPVLGVRIVRRGEGAPGLDTIVVSAPLLGVLGTVVGLMTACACVAGSAGTPVQVIAAGVAEALLPSALGLVIGLAALWMRAALEGRRPASRTGARDGKPGAAGVPT